MIQRVQLLEKQLDELRSEIAALKSGGVKAPELRGPEISPAKVENSPLVSAPKSGTLASILGPTSFSGFIDLYYLLNFNNPGTGVNGLRSFDYRGNQFGLNLMEFVIDKAVDASSGRTGYHIALGYGQAMNAIYASEPSPLSPDQFVKEAYFSYLVPLGKGLQIDAGKFVTPLGAEVIETKDNWNYSRGLLFSYAIPYFHFGVRAKYVFNNTYSLTGLVTNGWNNMIDNNDAKTYGVTFAWSPSKKVGVVQNFMIGPEQSDVNKNWRQSWDTVVTVFPTKQLTLMANYEYSRGDRIAGIVNPVWWTGIGGYFKYTLSDNYAIAGRYEYFNDRYGFNSGSAGHVQEMTGTFERTIADRLLTRVEFRHDRANKTIFTTGSSTPVNSQTTVTAGMVYSFDTRREAK